MKKIIICKKWKNANWKIRIKKQKLAKIVLGILIILIIVCIIEIMKM